jgi:nucleotide-binding universal stress UspA family protein
VGRGNAEGERAVVVGVDEPDRNRIAIEWAAREAAVRGVPLLVVHAFVWPLLRVPPAVAAIGPAGGLRAHAKELLAESAELATSAAPGVRVQSLLRTAFPDELLATQSRTASYVVLGSRGLRTFGRLVVGSTTMRLVVRSRCPVVVVRSQRPAPSSDTPVVVGVDGSTHSPAAIEAAIDLASHRQAELHVVHVTASAVSGAQIDVGELVAPWRASHPDVPIRTLLLEGRPHKVLVELSKASRAVVVGARGLGGVASLLIGSVSQALISSARCPVVVVPSRTGEPLAE